MTLFTSGEPFAMCVGGIFWSGIKRVVCAAKSEDIEHLTSFNEGLTHPEWIKELQNKTSK